MSEPNSNMETQPQMLAPAIPTYIQPAPARGGGGMLRGLVIMIALLGIIGSLAVAGAYYVGSSLVGGTDARVEEVYHSGNLNSLHKIAIVPVEDMIIDSTARHVISAIKAASEDEHVMAVVLKVDSPGGTISASDHIYRKVKELCRGPGDRKPVVVSMQGLAASGGYYISAPANRIFAERTTMTGSIGVIASFPNFSGLMMDFKIGMEVIKTGPMKDSGSMFRPMSDDERRRWQEIIGDAFETFLGVVQEGRNMSMEDVRRLATGEVYTAREAAQNGLVDEIGYLEDAIASAEKLAGVSDSKVIEYKKPMSLTDILFGSTSARRTSAAMELESLLRANVPRVMFLTQASGLEL